MNNINTLEELYYTLFDNYYYNYNNNYNNFIDLSKYIKNYKGDDWKKYVTFSNTEYKRIKLTDYSNNDFELLLLCWSPNQITRIHDHANNGCIMKVLEGTLIETLYDYDLRLLDSTVINTNIVSVIDNHIGLHQIKTKDYAVSLHLYSPPNYCSNLY